MVTLYNKVDFLKKINNDGRGGGRGGRQVADRRQNGADGKDKDKDKDKDKEGKEGEDDEKKKKKKREGLHPAVKTTGRLIMAFRNLSVTYSESDGMMLPGMNSETSLFGMDNFGAPSFAFVAGQQNRDLLGRQTNAWVTVRALTGRRPEPQ